MKEETIYKILAVIVAILFLGAIYAERIKNDNLKKKVSELSLDLDNQVINTAILYLAGSSLDNYAEFNWMIRVVKSRCGYQQYNGFQGYDFGYDTESCLINYEIYRDYHPEESNEPSVLDERYFDNGKELIYCEPHGNYTPESPCSIGGGEDWDNDVIVGVSE